MHILRIALKRDENKSHLRAEDSEGRVCLQKKENVSHAVEGESWMRDNSRNFNPAGHVFVVVLLVVLTETDNSAFLTNVKQKKGPMASKGRSAD